MCENCNIYVIIVVCYYSINYLDKCRVKLYHPHS